MATEIAILPIHGGRLPDDSSSEGGQAWRDVTETLTQQPGFQRCYWGREVENPNNLRLFVDWDSVDDHITFTKASHYGPFIERANFLLDMKNATLFHAHYQPHPPQKALSDAAGVGATEILTVYFPKDYSDADKKAAEESLQKLVDALQKGEDVKGFHGASGGWVVEPRPIPDSGDQEGLAFSAVLGWDSVEAHMAARETQTFKDNIHYLRGVKDLKGINVVHASCKEVTRG